MANKTENTVTAAAATLHAQTLAALEPFKTPGVEWTARQVRKARQRRDGKRRAVAA